MNGYEDWVSRRTWASAAVTFATVFALSLISSALADTVGPSWG
jgi:hypothetical protein